MEGFVKGDILTMIIPFSDGTDSKKRPVLVIASTENNEVIVCPITSKITGRMGRVALRRSDFASGTLPLPESEIKTDSIYTAAFTMAIAHNGRLKNGIIGTVISNIKIMLDRG